MNCLEQHHLSQAQRNCIAAQATSETTLPAHCLGPRDPGQSPPRPRQAAMEALNEQEQAVIKAALFRESSLEKHGLREQSRLRARPSGRPANPGRAAEVCRGGGPITQPISSKRLGCRDFGASQEEADEELWGPRRLDDNRMQRQKRGHVVLAVRSGLQSPRSWRKSRKARTPQLSLQSSL